MTRSQLNTNLNMATTPMWQFIKPPDVFEVGDSVEKFIEEVEKFFELTQTGEEQRGIFIKAFLSVEATRKYEAMIGEVDYRKRIQKAFAKPANLAEDLKAALTFKRGEESSSDFFKKIETLARNVLRHELNEEELKSFILLNAITDQEIRKDIKMQGLKTFQEMKERVVKTEDVRREIECDQEVLAIQPRKTYAEVSEGRKEWPTKQNLKPKPYSTAINRQSWQEQHQRRNGPRDEGIKTQSYFNIQNRPRNIKCWACREEGHVRSQCPNVQCSHCKKKGHFRYQCYEAKPERARNNRKYMATINDDYDEPSTSRASYQYSDRRETDQENSRRTWMNERHADPRESSYDRPRRDEDPNGYAPIQGEVLGAMN